MTSVHNSSYITFREAYIMLFVTPNNSKVAGGVTDHRNFPEDSHCRVASVDNAHKNASEKVSVSTVCGSSHPRCSRVGCAPLWCGPVLFHWCLISGFQDPISMLDCQRLHGASLLLSCRNLGRYFDVQGKELGSPL